jgi:hypothetical protein
VVHIFTITGCLLFLSGHSSHDGTHETQLIRKSDCIVLYLICALSSFSNFEIGDEYGDRSGMVSRFTEYISTMQRSWS